MCVTFHRVGAFFCVFGCLFVRCCVSVLSFGIHVLVCRERAPSCGPTGPHAQARELVVGGGVVAGRLGGDGGVVSVGGWSGGEW